jgi:hypothetical protein
VKGKKMTELNSVGPKEWSDYFYVDVISRKDDNHYAEVTDAMVAGWAMILPSLSKAVSSHFKSAIRVASVT